MSGSWTGTGLPPIAAARTAEARRSGTWSSALSIGEFAAIRSVGFEPVGQVMESAVYQVARGGENWFFSDCGYTPNGIFGPSNPPKVAVSGQSARSAALVRVLMEAGTARSTG